jgi:hypothetical protein
MTSPLSAPVHSSRDVKRGGIERERERERERENNTTKRSSLLDAAFQNSASNNNKNGL